MPVHGPGDGDGEADDGHVHGEAVPLILADRRAQRHGLEDREHAVLVVQRGEDQAVRIAVVVDDQRQALFPVDFVVEGQQAGALLVVDPVAQDVGTQVDAAGEVRLVRVPGVSS